MQVDIQKLTQKIHNDVSKHVEDLEKTPRLAIAQIGEPDKPTERFLAQKQKTGEGLGTEIKVFHYSGNLSNTRLRRRIASLVHSDKNDGVLLQLPLPEHCNTQYLLNAIPPRKDVEVLSAKALGRFLTGSLSVKPPMVGAVHNIVSEQGLEYKNKNIVLVGAGRLVGRPLALWLLQQDVGFSVITENSPNPKNILSDADVVISAVGQEGFLQENHLKEGALLIDVDKAHGGIGPLVVAHLFNNLVILAKTKT